MSATRQRRSRAVLLDERKPQFPALEEDRNEHALVLHVMNSDGSGVTQLTTGNFDDAEPTWSPDGSTIAFSRVACIDYSCKHDLFVMNRDGSAVMQLTSDDDDNYHPTWSPDGVWIAFIPGAPAVVNVAWNQRFASGLPPTLPLFVRCLVS